MSEHEQSRQAEVAPARKTNTFKSFLSTVSAGVIGSAITLGAVYYSDLDIAHHSNSQNENVSIEASAPQMAPSKASSTMNVSISDVIEKSSKSIVGIANYQNQRDPFSRSQGTVESGSGSGVIFKKTSGSAYIVTNNHVVEGASKLEVSFYNGKKTEAEIVGADALTDLAVVKVDAKYVDQTIKFGDSSVLRPGDEVLAIGNPLGLDLSRTVTQGIVSAVDRSISVPTSAGEWEMNVIQTDAAINPGNSGGALINTAGKVIGINSLKISQNGVEGLGFAIPSKDVVPIVNQLIEKGKVERPYLGVSLAELSQIPDMYLKALPDDVRYGTMVTYVAPNSAASKAGLQEQDVIVGINGEKVENSTDLRRNMYTKLHPGDQANLKIYREGKLITVKVTLAGNSSVN